LDDNLVIILNSASDHCGVRNVEAAGFGFKFLWTFVDNGPFSKDLTTLLAISAMRGCDEQSLLPRVSHRGRGDAPLPCHVSLMIVMQMHCGSVTRTKKCRKMLKVLP
jgi:hypothetical protein